MFRYLTILLSMIALVAVKALAAKPRALPPVLSECDPGKTTAAQLGRDKILAAAQAKPEAILCITGGGLAAVGGSPTDRAARAVALIDAAGVDVVNLAHRDLTGDLSALSSARAKIISSSFRMAEGAPAPWADVAFVERGGKKYAVIGLASQSSAMADEGVIPGLIYVKPKDALAAAMGKVGDAAGVIVLADLPLSDLKELLDSSPQVDLFVVSGRAGGSATIPGASRVFRAPAGGASLGIFGAGDIALHDPAEPSAAFKELSSKWDVAEKPIASSAPASTPVAPLLGSLSSGKLAPVSVVGRNRAVSLTIKSAGLLDRFGDTIAPEGSKLLVLDAAFENVLTPQVVQEKKVPVEYQVANLYDNLYVVADAMVLRRGEGDASAGELPPGKLELPRMGATASGKIIMEVPAGFSPKNLAVRFYDFTHGNLALDIVGVSQHGKGEPAPNVFQKNEVVLAAPYAMNKLAEFAGVKALAGMNFIAVDLRMKSLMTIDADATAYDPSAKPGQQIKIGTVADWKESRKYMQLIVDGRYGYSPEPSGSLREEPRFLPDVMTGGTVIFLAPADAKSVELRCDFPNVAVNGETKPIHPAGLTFALEGKPPVAADAKPIAQTKDSLFDVSIIGQGVQSKVGDTAADEGQSFFVLDVVVRNISPGGEFFQPKGQLKYATAGGDQLDFDDLSYQLPHRPWEQLWIPGGQSRAFQVVYKISTDERKPRLAFASTDEGGSKVLDLQDIHKAGPDPAQ